MFFGPLIGHDYCHSECQYHAGMKDPFYISEGGRFLHFFTFFDCSISRDSCAAHTSVHRPQTDCRMLLGVRSLPANKALTSVKVPPAIPTTFCETLLLYSYVAGGAVHNPPFLFFLQSMMRARSSSLEEESIFPVFRLSCQNF